MKKRLILMSVLCLFVTGIANADTTFSGGDLGEASNWDNGQPSSGNDGIVDVDGSLDTGAVAQRHPWMVGATVTVGNGATLSFSPDISAYQGTLIINDATVNCADDVFADYGTLILNSGSVTTAVDDWESNDHEGRIIVNGGTHNSGTGTGNNVGAQGSSSKLNCGIDFRGGIVTAGNFRFQPYSVSSVGGSAVLQTYAGGTFSDAQGAIDILPSWTGTWTVDSFGPGSWESLITNAANGFTVDGVSVDSASFASTFVVSTDGKTLSLIQKWAHDPIPATMATNIPTSQTLGWLTGLDSTGSTNTDITKHYLYMQERDPGQDPNLLEVTPVEITGVDPSGVTAPVTLQMDKRYYWRVDESILDSAANDANTITGSVWYFDTIKSVPEITAGPEDVAAFPTETASLTVEFTSISPVASNVWEVSTDLGATWSPAGGSVSLDQISSPKTSTLTFSSVALTDEGLYRCTVTNIGGSDTSETAALVVKRRLAYYEFEGDMTDSEGSNNGTAKHSGGLTPDITYSTDSVIGTQSVVFNASASETDPNQSYIELPLTAYPNADLGGGLETGTIYCWVKTDNPGTILGAFNDGYTTGFNFSVQGDTYGRLLVRNESASTIQPTMNDDSLTDGDKWYFIAATWEIPGTSRTYIGQLTDNGKRIAVDDNSYIPDFSDWAYPLTIGAVNSRGIVADFFENGTKLDDLQVYNYAFTPEEVAAVFNTVTGNSMCLSYSYEGAAFDFNGDCVVNLSDFAEFANAWLATGLSDGN